MRSRKTAARKSSMHIFMREWGKYGNEKFFLFCLLKLKNFLVFRNLKLKNFLVWELLWWITFHNSQLIYPIIQPPILFINHKKSSTTCGSLCFARLANTHSEPASLTKSCVKIFLTQNSIKNYFTLFTKSNTCSNTSLH